MLTNTGCGRLLNNAVQQFKHFSPQNPSAAKSHIADAGSRPYRPGVTLGVIPIQRVAP